MRKLFCFFLSLSIGVAACSKSPTAPSIVVPPAQTCTYAISTTTFNIAGSGGTATMSVNTAAGCAWSVSNTSSFVTITSGSSGTGPGTISFSIGENPGDARVGTFTVGGQTITINQTANDAVYGNWGGTIVKGSGCAATLPASVDYTGTIRRTSGATNEFVISIPTVGIVNQTIALTINGSTLQFFVPIDTLYTFNATLSSDRRSLSGTFSGGSCTGTWTGSRR